LLHFCHVFSDLPKCLNWHIHMFRLLLYDQHRGLYDCVDTSSAVQNSLCERIVLHMNRINDYRDPDISLNSLASSLFTNRTTLTNALHELGYVNFNTYINMLRIEDFIQRIRNKESVNYQEAFYDAGFRSRAIALRNFKQYTGKTPSEYFAGEDSSCHNP